MIAEKTLYILDAYAFIYRSFYAFNSKPLINSDGFNVGSIFGFFKTLHSLMKKYKPAYFVVALDSKVPTFRHKMYKEYKANRRETPIELHNQVPVIEDVLRTCGFAIEEKAGYEADDIIASLTKQARQEGFNVRIISGDKDLLQLVGTDSKMLKSDKMGKWDEYGMEEVQAEWSVLPSYILDLLSLTGDSADNVPGVKGVGLKTAAKLLNEYKSLEGIYENIESIKGAIKTKLLAGKEDAFFSKKLIILDDSLEMKKISEYATSHINLALSIPIFKKYELPSLAKIYSEPLLWKEKNNEEVLDLQKIMKERTDASAIHITKFSQLKEILHEGGKAFYITLLLTEDAINITLDFAIMLGEAQYTFLLTFDGFLAKLEDDETSREEVINILNSLFASDSVFIMYDAKITYHIMKKYSLNFPKKVFDAMIAIYLIQPSRKDYSFEDVSSALLEEVEGENARSEIKSLKLLYNILSKQLENLGLTELFWNIEMLLIPILAEMEENGIRLDKEYLKNFEKELTEKIAMLENNATFLVGEEINLASYKQLQTLLFEKRGLIPAKKIKTGFSTSSEVLEKLIDDDPLIPVILEYRTLSKLKSTYTATIIDIADKDSRVHTHFIQTGTATGRLSSQNPNLQNIPARSDLGLKVRCAFCSEEGKKLISSDYSQIELVVLAHLSNDEVLQKIIREGKDVHKRTASLIFNVAEELVTSDMRAMAKAVNFGVIYGMSAYGLSEELHISLKVAKDFINSYFDTYKGVENFIEEAYRKCEESGEVRTIFGRRRDVLEIRSSKKQTRELGQRLAVNTIIQGSAADIMKKAMIDVDLAIKESKLDAKILLQVHDELILEARDSDVDQVTTLVKETMEKAYSLSVPLRCSVSSGKKWGNL